MARVSAGMVPSVLPTEVVNIVADREDDEQEWRTRHHHIRGITVDGGGRQLSSELAAVDQDRCRQRPCQQTVKIDNLVRQMTQFTKTDLIWFDANVRALPGRKRQVV